MKTKTLFDKLVIDNTTSKKDIISFITRIFNPLCDEDGVWGIKQHDFAYRIFSKKYIPCSFGFMNMNILDLNFAVHIKSASMIDNKNIYLSFINEEIHETYVISDKWTLEFYIENYIRRDGVINHGKLKLTKPNSDHCIISLTEAV